MLTDSKLRSQVDMLWDKLWTGGLTNPLDSIEQLSYLLFLKRLDDEENRRQKIAQLVSSPTYLIFQRICVGVTGHTLVLLMPLNTCARRSFPGSAS